ncbi:MAG: XdhC family protein [Planctomycetia bacterium]|nr:XdhC family protein [Planctomycetia bacterium]
MRELLNQLLDSVSGGRPVAWCRLVETRGSTPQKAGAAMLVFADGSQAGTLGGGCVEAEVKRRALAVLSGGKAEICSFQLDSDYGWDDGLICGGRMQVLVEPIASPDRADYFRRFADLLAAGQGFLEAIVFDAQKSQLAAPACYLIDADGRLIDARHGPVVDGEPPPAVRESMPELSTRPRAQAVSGIAYLPNLPRCTLVIVGGGHVGQAVGNLAPEVDFDVWVVDDRAEYVARERFPRAARLIQGEIGPTLAGLDITPNTYCLIVTRGHNHDEEALAQLVDRGARYVGMIGSRRKIRLIFDDLESQGVSPDALAKVFAPVGIDIGSQTVTEIAISILAELVAHRNLCGQVPGRPSGALALDS